MEALKWAERCLTDAQSQQDLELVLQFLTNDDFKNAYSIYSVVSQQMSRVSPTSPITAQAQDLSLEVRVKPAHTDTESKGIRLLSYFVARHSLIV